MSAASSEDFLFLETSWVTVMLGQGMVPSGHDPSVDALPTDETHRFVRHVREVIDKTARSMTTHQKSMDQVGVVVKREVV